MVVQVDQGVHQFRRDAGMAPRQGLNAQGQRQASDGRPQQGTDADGVAAQEVFLQGQHLVRLDALTAQLAEAGVDAIEGFAAGEQIDQAGVGAVDAPAGGRRQGQLIDVGVEDAARIGQGQVLAVQFQDGRSAGDATHISIIYKRGRRRWIDIDGLVFLQEGAS